MMTQGTLHKLAVMISVFCSKVVKLVPLIVGMHLKCHQLPGEMIVNMFT